MRDTVRSSCDLLITSFLVGEQDGVAEMSRGFRFDTESIWTNGVDWKE